MGHPVYQWTNPSCLYTHAHNALFNYGVVMVSRILERANENDGFKMTALELFIMGETEELIMGVISHFHVFPYFTFLPCPIYLSKDPIFPTNSGCHIVRKL